MCARPAALAEYRIGEGRVSGPSGAATEQKDEMVLGRRSLSQQMTITAESKASATVYIGTGLPTHQELLDHYPAKFTWQELKVFVNSGFVPLNRFRCLPLTNGFSELGLLKRDKMLQLRYNDWSEEIKQKWGTLGPYLYPLLPKNRSHPQTIPFERELPVEVSSSVGSTRQTLGFEAIHGQRR